MTRELIASELQKLGVAPREAQAIADDVEKLDARSLLLELLLTRLWSIVIDETKPDLLPKIGGAAIQRLLSGGANPDDLIDVVRETQIDAIYSVANLLDWPAEGVALDEKLDMQISVGFPALGGNYLPIYNLHSCLMERDPTGRHGEFRSLEERQLQKIQGDDRDELENLIRGRKLSAAALIWKKYAGGELKNCLTEVQSLYEKLR